MSKLLKSQHQTQNKHPKCVKTSVQSPFDTHESAKDRTTFGTRIHEKLPGSWVVLAIEL